MQLRRPPGQRSSKTFAFSTSGILAPACLATGLSAVPEHVGETAFLGMIRIGIDVSGDSWSSGSWLCRVLFSKGNRAAFFFHGRNTVQLPFEESAFGIRIGPVQPPSQGRNPTNHSGQMAAQSFLAPGGRFSITL